MKIQIEELSKTVKSEMQTLRGIKSTADTFVARRADLQAEAVKFADEHDFSLDARSATKAASINGGIALAKACAPRLLQLVKAALVGGVGRAGSIKGRIEAIHREIDTLIEDSLLAKIPEDLREGVDVLANSKAFRAEVIARREVGEVPTPHPDAKEDPAMAAISMGHLLEFLERCEAELVRCQATVDQYSPAEAVA